MKGKVWLVGAGPGDAGLLTVKGQYVLNDAEVVVYDSLVGLSILACIPETAEKINVGKRAGNHTMRQEEINKVLLEKALEGKRVVRLKGGDPFLFGRGGEELVLLKENGIEYEVVPGVTSSIAVPAYNGIPVTHRDFTSSVHIITGHKKAGEEYDIDFEALVKTGGTLVFLMGVKSLGDICINLIKAGMDADTPAAILQQGTTSDQRRVVATVSTLLEEATAAGIKAPAIIVVGKVCQLADEFAWYEELPLAGSRILLTRPRDLISKMATKLRKLGAEVLELPSIVTEYLADSDALSEAIVGIDSYKWIVFTSPTGVKMFFRGMADNSKDIRAIAGAKVAAIGSATAKSLKEHGIIADLVPAVYDGENLGRELAKEVEAGDEVLIPRADIGNQILVDLLEEAGAIVADVPTYTTMYQEQEVVDIRALIEAGQIDCAVFTSASTVRGFMNAVKDVDCSNLRAACIGKQTKAQADEYGMKTEMADKATMEDLAELVVRMMNE